MLGFQLEARLKEVGIQSRRLVEPAQRSGCGQTFQPAVAGQLANNGAILLLDPRLIVLVVGAAPCEYDVLLAAICQ
jgi:ABC-type histidine transport system ATPase subunit